MAYVVPFNANVHDNVAQFGFRTDATIETRKGKKVQIVWTPTGYQGFVIFEQSSRMFLTWDKHGKCDTFTCEITNKDYDLFYRVREAKPSPIHQMALDALVYCEATIKMTCQTEEVIQFNLDKYMSGGYELETRNGFKVSALEFTGDERKVFRGADNMKHLRWTKTGKINANGIGHELDLMMRKVKDK